MPLPFLRLPDLVKTQVLLEVEPFDFYVFSLVSSKTKAIAASSNKKIDKLTWNFRKNGYSLHLISDKRTISLYVPIRDIHQHLTSLKFDGETLPMVCCPLYYKMSIGSNDLSNAEQKKLLEQMSDHVVDIFKIENFILSGYIFPHKDLVSKYTKKLKMISMNDDYVQAEFTDILGMFSVEQFVMACGRIRVEGCDFDRPLNMKYLDCHDLEWLSDEALASLECRSVIIHPKDFGNDIGRVVRAWETGGLKQLEKFRVKTHHTTLEALTRVLEEFQLTDGDSYSRTQREDGASAIVAVNRHSALRNEFVMRIER